MDSVVAINPSYMQPVATTAKEEETYDGYEEALHPKWWQRIIDFFLGRHRASEWDDYFENVNTDWDTFRPDDGIWCEYRLQRPSIAYYRQLHKAYESVIEYVRNYYACDPEQLKEEIKTLQQKVYDLSAELYEEKGKNAGLTRQLTSALKWQSATGEENQVRSEMGVPLKVVSSQPRQGNKFASYGDLSGKEKKMAAIALKIGGYSDEEIREMLQLEKTSSVVTYVSGMKKHCNVISENGSPKFLSFDEEYGGDTWTLDSFMKEKVSQAV